MFVVVGVCLKRFCMFDCPVVGSLLFCVCCCLLCVFVSMSWFLLLIDCLLCVCFVVVVVRLSFLVVVLCVDMFVCLFV